MSVTLAGPVEEPAEWLVEINAPRPGNPVVMPLAEMPMGGPLMAPDLPVPALSEAPVLRFSYRGRIAEPDDAIEPNRSYPARLAAPPLIARELPIYPDEERRAQYNEAELDLLNQDGELEALEGDWRFGGAVALLLRGPHRRPLQAPRSHFQRVAEMRVIGAPRGTTRLQVPLSSIAAELSGPACTLFGGTGGADGPEGLAGQPRQEVFGYVPNLSPILVDAALGIWHVHARAMQEILAARDRGMSLTRIGFVASYAALAAAPSPTTGQYLVCLASGHIRTGGGVQALTVDVRGDVGAGGYGGGIPARLAVQILRGPGGISAERCPEAGFLGWPAAEAGVVLRQETVAEALNRLAAGIYAWWGGSAFGVFGGGVIAAPEGRVPAVTLDDFALAGPPEEMATPRPPWWRSSVGYQVLDTVQAADALAGAVSDEDRAFYGQATRNAVLADVGLRALYPLAEDGPPIPGVLREKPAAEAVAARVMALCGRPRRDWSVSLRNADLLAQLEPGTCVRVRWSRHPAWVVGRNLLVRAVQGEGERPELVMWG